MNEFQVIENEKPNGRKDILEVIAILELKKGPLRNELKNYLLNLKSFRDPNEFLDYLGQY